MKIEVKEYPADLIEINWGDKLIVIEYTKRDIIFTCKWFSIKF